MRFFIGCALKKNFQQAMPIKEAFLKSLEKVSYFVNIFTKLNL